MNEHISFLNNPNVARTVYKHFGRGNGTAFFAKLLCKLQNCIEQKQQITALTAACVQKVHAINSAVNTTHEQPHEHAPTCHPEGPWMEIPEQEDEYEDGLCQTQSEDSNGLDLFY